MSCFQSLKEDNPKAALESFQRVLDLENGEKGEWGFKALKQMIKINFRLSNFDEMMLRYKQLLTYIKSAVTRNHSEKSINSILDYISTSQQMELLQNFYETTLDALRDAKNERLWFKTMTKLGKLYFDRGEYNRYGGGGGGGGHILCPFFSRFQIYHTGWLEL